MGGLGIVFKALGAIDSLRLLPRLKLSSGVVRCPKICAKSGSRYASLESDHAFLIKGNNAKISGLYVITNGTPTSLRSFPLDLVTLSTMTCLDGIVSRVLFIRSVD